MFQINIKQKIHIGLKLIRKQVIYQTLIIRCGDINGKIQSFILWNKKASRGYQA